MYLQSALEHIDEMPQKTFDEIVEKYGSKHIGGISYYNGFIYASLEDSKIWSHPVIALYDAQTLEYTGQAHELPNSILTRGIPWVSVDAANGLLYSSYSKTAEVIYCFDRCDSGRRGLRRKALCRFK